MRLHRDPRRARQQRQRLHLRPLPQQQQPQRGDKRPLLEQPSSGGHRQRQQHFLTCVEPGHRTGECRLIGCGVDQYIEAAPAWQAKVDER